SIVFKASSAVKGISLAFATASNSATMRFVNTDVYWLLLSSIILQSRIVQRVFSTPFRQAFFQIDNKTLLLGRAFKPAAFRTSLILLTVSCETFSIAWNSI